MVKMVVFTVALTVARVMREEGLEVVYNKRRARC